MSNPPPLSLTPQSLKRKLQHSIEPYDNDNIIISSTSDIVSDLSSQTSPPTELFLPHSPTNHYHHRNRSSPLRISQSSSPTRSIRTSSIVHSNLIQGQASNFQLMSSLQLSQVYKFFSKHPAPFPLELLKSTVLADIFLKGRALERYFQRRNDEIKQNRSGSSSDFGLKALQRPFVRSSPPSVPFSVYLERLFRFCHPEALHLVAIVAYSERLIKTHSSFVPLLGIHRFVVAAWIVAGKALLGDQYWTNQYWARVAGISIVEICILENELIRILGWKLQIPFDELTAAWYLIQL